jgi:uncharacterized protein with von Willebrand factor type A (vWA) domain
MDTITYTTIDTINLNELTSREIHDTPSEPVLSRKALLNALDDRAVVVQFFQNCPYTCVAVRAWYDQHEYIGFGFSKVCYPDKWDCEQGAEIAKRRALIMILHQIRSHEKAVRLMEAFGADDFEIPF